MSNGAHPKPDISVCVANFNGVPYIRDCLASVYAQKGGFSVEVLLHDDNSTDESIDLIRSEFPLVHVLESASNVGFCISNNRMVAAAEGRYVLLLNNDAVLRPGSLRTLLAYAESGHSQDVLGLPQRTLIDGSLMDRGYRTDVFLNPVPVMSTGPNDVGIATGACLWIPKTVWDAVGGFPDWFESVAEDIYLCVAARLLGYKVTVLAGPEFDHWVGKNLGGGKVVEQRLQSSVRRRALSERNKTFVMLLCYPGPVLLLVLPVHAAMLGIEAIFLLLARTDRAKVRQIYFPIPDAVWRQRKRWLALRGRLKARRRCTLSHFLAQTTWLPHKLVMLLRHGVPELR